MTYNEEKYKTIKIDPQDDWELEVADKDFKVNREMQTKKEPNRNLRKVYIWSGKLLKGLKSKINAKRSTLEHNIVNLLKPKNIEETNLQERIKSTNYGKIWW